MEGDASPSLNSSWAMDQNVYCFSLSSSNFTPES